MTATPAGQDGSRMGNIDTQAAREFGSAAVEPAERSTHRFPWIVLALVVAGALLRFYRLGAQSYWVDELLTIGAAEVGGKLGVREFFGNVQGPLHALLVHLISRASTSEYALRSASAIAGVAAIPACYLLGKELFDRKVGYAAALLVTVSPFAIWYSQEARSYSILILLSAAAALLVSRAVKGARGAWAPYVLGIAAAVYCNLSALFLAVAHALHATWQLRRGRRRLGHAVAAFAVAAVLVSPLGWGVTRWVQREDVVGRARFTPQAEAQDLLRGETTMSPLALPYSLFAMGYGYSLGPGMRELHEEPPAEAFRRHAALVVPAGLAFAAALLLGIRRAAANPSTLRLTLLSLLVPVGASVTLAVFNIKPMNARYVAVVFPILVVTTAAGVASLRGLAGRLLCGAVIVFCGVSLWGYYQSPAYWKADVRAAARHVESREEPGDAVLVPVVRDVFNFYYSGAAERFVLFRGQTGSGEEVASRIADGAGSAERLWLVDARLWFVDPGRAIPEYLDAHYERLESAAFPGVSVTLYSLSPVP